MISRGLTNSEDSETQGPFSWASRPCLFFLPYHSLYLSRRSLVFTTLVLFIMAPFASIPPFATDLPDSAYAQPQPQPRYRQPPKDDPNTRTSAYNQCVRFLSSSFRVIYPSLVATMRTWMARVSKADMFGRQRGIHV